MPSLSDVLTFREKMYQKSTALIKKKGADYNRDQQIKGDTLFNLKVCEILGIVGSAEEGILVRLSDKFMRLISLTKPGREAEVKDESVLDTIADIANYVDYLGLLWQERKQREGQRLSGQRSGQSETQNEPQPTSVDTIGDSASNASTLTVGQSVVSAGSATYGRSS